MKTVPISRIMSCGVIVHFLKGAQPGWPIRGADSLAANVSRLDRVLQELRMEVTRRSCGPLLAFAGDLESRGDGAHLSAHEAQRIREMASAVEHTLSAEASSRSAYVVEDTRYPAARLMGEQHLLFAVGVYADLPAVAQQDLAEGTKCIALGLPTAAAFHILRGTEAVLREYCARVCGGPHCKIGSPWGTFISMLRQEPTAEPSITDALDSIRKFFRNPTLHPDKCYDIAEAQDLLGLCVDIVDRMVRSGQWQARKTGSFLGASADFKRPSPVPKE